MKNALSFLACVIILSISLNSNAQVQNPIWSIPSNYHSFIDGYLSLPTGPNAQDYQGDPAEYAHNAMHDVDGDLLFFIVDEKVYDHQGYFIGAIQR